MRRDFVGTFSREWAEFIDVRLQVGTHHIMVSAHLQFFMVVVSADLE